MNDAAVSLAQLLGAGTLGAVLLEIVKRIFARADTRDQLAIGLRTELVNRLATLEHQCAEIEQRERDYYRRVVRLEAENHHLRQRYRDLVLWLQSRPELPTPPPWLTEPVSGPTKGQSDV